MLDTVDTLDTAFKIKELRHIFVSTTLDTAGHKLDTGEKFSFFDWTQKP